MDKICGISNVLCTLSIIHMYLNVYSVTEQQHSILKVHSHVSSHSLLFLICSQLFHLFFLCSGSWLTVLFWIFPYDSYLSVLILNAFLASVCYPFVFIHSFIHLFIHSSYLTFHRSTKTIASLGYRTCPEYTIGYIITLVIGINPIPSHI